MEQVRFIKLISGLNLVGEIEKKDNSFFVKRAIIVNFGIMPTGELAVQIEPASLTEPFVSNVEIPKEFVLAEDFGPQYDKIFEDFRLKSSGLATPDDLKNIENEMKEPKLKLL